MKNDAVEIALLNRLSALRWKSGLRCPRCNGADCSVHARSGALGRRKFLCGGCGRTFNDLTGTILARSHLPLSTWFAAAKLMTSPEPTCAYLARKLRVKLATAWRVRRILSRASADPVLRRFFEEEGLPPCS